MYPIQKYKLKAPNQGLYSNFYFQFNVVI